MPGTPAGHFAIRAGALLAATDEFAVTITGVGGHGAAPHQAVDPNLAAAHVMLALQSIASRNVDPLENVVLSVCTLSNDSAAFNVIPQTVTLGGTVRTLKEDVRDLVETRFHKLVQATADAYGCTAQITYTRGYPVTVNTAAETRYAADVARNIAGSSAVDDDTPPIMAGEDFAYMLEARPGAYIFLGNGEEGAMVHHPEYIFNDAAIPAGCAWLAGMVEARMPAP